MPWFDQFHQLAEEQVIDISSDSEQESNQEKGAIVIDPDSDEDENQIDQGMPST